MPARRAGTLDINNLGSGAYDAPKPGAYDPQGP